jgi:hypothetical protein
VNDTTAMRRVTLEQVGLAVAAIIGLLPGAHALLTDRLARGEVALGLLVAAFCLSQLFRKQE